MLTFTLQEGWLGLFPDDEDEIALEASGGVILAMTRVSQVVDPATGRAVVVPDDLIEWFTTHPRLTAQPPVTATIAGLAGRWVDIKASNGGELEIFAFETGNLRVPAGVTFRCLVLPLEGPDLTIVIGAPEAGFEAATATVQPVLDSLVVATGG